MTHERLTYLLLTLIAGLICTIILLLSGCVPKDVPPGYEPQALRISPTRMNSYCVPESIKCAIVWQDKTGFPARIELTQNPDNPFINHAQAQGWDGWEWVYLTADASQVYAFRKHFPEWKVVDVQTVEDFAITQTTKQVERMKK